MNRWQKEVLQSQLNDEKAVIKELKKSYESAIKNIDIKIAQLRGRTDVKNLQSIIYQIDYQNALKEQISGILDEMNAGRFNTISEYLAKCYESGFYGTMYDLNGQGIPLIFPIDQKEVVKAVLTNSKLSDGLYQRLLVDIKNLKTTIRTELSRGIASNLPYIDIARNISARSKVSLNNTMRIVRTEGHRISTESAFQAQIRAQSKGANIVKQWDATLDARTRDSHAAVDGELRELEEKFSNGLRYPSDSQNGSAAEVVNCRCALLQRATWALDEDELQTLKDRAEYFGLDKTENFEDFKRKYIKAAENDVIERMNE